MNKKQLQELLTDAFVAAGFSIENAYGLADFTEKLSRVRARSIAAEFFVALRGTIHGEAVYRALVADDTESLECAARRLHCDPSVLRRHRGRIQDLLEERAFLEQLAERFD